MPQTCSIIFLGGPTLKEAVIDCTVVSDLIIKDLQDLCDMPVLPFSVQIDYIHNTPDWSGLNLSVISARDPSSIVVVLYRYKGLRRAKRVQNKSAPTACQD